MKLIQFLCEKSFYLFIICEGNILVVLGWCWDWAGGDGGAVGLAVWFGVADSWACCGVGGGLFG